MEKIAFENDVRSVVNINYQLDKAGIQDTFNTIIDEQLAGDMEFTGYDLDISVKKYGDAKFEFDGKRILVNLPLEIFLEKETFISNLKAKGILNMTFVSDLEVDSTWNLVTETGLEDYTWIKEPQLSLGVMSLPIERIANGIIEKSKDEVAKNIDITIRDHFELRNKMLDMMKIIEEPYQLDSAFNMFVTLQPDTVFMTPTWNTKDWTEGQIGVFVKTNMSSTKPEVIPGIQLPDFQWSEKLDSSSVFRVQLELDHKHIQSILDDNLVGRTFANDGQEITIHDIELNGFKEKIELTADVSGSFNGTLVLRGKPVFNNDTNIIEVKDLDIKVKTKNILHKAASWLFKGKIKNSIEENMIFSVDEYIELAQESVDHFLTDINQDGGIDLSLKLQDSHITGILITDEQIFLGVDLYFLIHAKIFDVFSFENWGGTLPKLKN